MHYRWFIHVPVGGYFGCFQFGMIMNKAAVNTHTQVFVYTYILISLELKCSSSIAGYSKTNMVLTSQGLANCLPFLLVMYENSKCSQPCLFYHFNRYAVVSVILFCIFLMAIVVEYISMYLLFFILLLIQNYDSKEKGKNR